METIQQNVESKGTL